MTSILVPGYRSLFGEPTQTYEELVKDLPSDIVISIAIALNNELNASGREEEENQKRLREIVSFRFSDQQLAELNKVYSRFKQLAGASYRDAVFGRRYLIALVVKELERNASFKIEDTSADQEYNFLKAYLLVVDEVNDKDTKYLAAVKGLKDDLSDYRLIWTSFLSQYQFNERPEMAFELFRLICFLKYALDNYPEFLREYLHLLCFTNISGFLSSFAQLATAANHENKNEALSRLTYIKPDLSVDASHLKSLSVNEVKLPAINVPQLKKFPLYHTRSNGFMVIDRDFYMKKMYKGPYFDLFYKTSFSTKTKFNSYSSTIAKKVLEEICFQNVMQCLRSTKHDVIHFDDSTDAASDCYGRHNNAVFLCEFKAYLFPDDFPEQPDFDAMKKYIDERFIEAKPGKPKGVGQLVNQIHDFINGKFAFDVKCDEEFRKGPLKIYPIIVVDDFHFTMPGINEYLNNQFRDRLGTGLPSNITIKNLTVINQDLLFDFASRGGTFKELESMIDRYWKIIGDRKRKLDKPVDDNIMDTFLRSKTSFDEIYHTIMLPDWQKQRYGRPKNLMDNLDITQGDLDMTV